MSLFKNIFTKSKSKSVAKSAEVTNSESKLKNTTINPFNYADPVEVVKVMKDMLQLDAPIADQNSPLKPASPSRDAFKDYLLTHFKNKKPELVKLASNFSLTISLNKEHFLKDLETKLSATWENKYTSILDIKAEHENAAIYASIKALLTKDEILLCAVMSSNESDLEYGMVKMANTIQSPVIRLKYTDNKKIAAALDDALPKFIKKQIETVYFHSAP